MAGHHATVYSTGRHGCWSHCSCGWRSPVMTSTEGASVQYARHFADQTQTQEKPR